MSDIKSQLKSMLESTNRLDTSSDPPSPLSEADPKALDLFFDRLDSEMKLGNVPKPEDKNRIITYYQNLKLKFLEDERMNAAKEVRKPRPKSIKSETSKFGII